MYTYTVTRNLIRLIFTVTQHHHPHTPSLDFLSFLPHGFTKSRLWGRRTPAVRRAPHRRASCHADRTGAGGRSLGEQIARRRRHLLVPAGVAREMEVGRWRGLVEEEVAHGDLPFLLVLHDGPVDERDETFHGLK